MHIVLSQKCSFSSNPEKSSKLIYWNSIFLNGFHRTCHDNWILINNYIGQFEGTKNREYP